MPKFITQSNLLTRPYLTRRLSTSINYPSIPKLTVLENTKRMIIDKKLLPNLENKNIFVVGVQHILESTGSLFKILGEFVPPQRMFFAGKCYSTNATIAAAIQDMGVTLVPGTTPAQLGMYQQTHLSDVRKMWEICLKKLKKTKKIDGIIILDDGSTAIEMASSIIDCPIIGIVQTRGGMYSNLYQQIPIINVAQSDAKQRLESWLIQEKIINKLKIYLSGIDKQNDAIGIVGCGAIGLSLTLSLAADGYEKIFIYDENSTVYPENLPKNIIPSSLKQLFFESRFVFGCTGRDITENIDLLKINNKSCTFASCSSGDIEFKSFLLEICKIHKDAPINMFQDIEFSTPENRKIHIINSGFPVNFDRQSTSVPNNQIALTRGLLFCAFVQALFLIFKYSPSEIRTMGNIMLSPELQKFVIEEWQKTLEPELKEKLPFRKVELVELIKKNSAGVDLSKELMGGMSSQPTMACAVSLKS